MKIMIGAARGEAEAFLKSLPPSTNGVSASTYICKAMLNVAGLTANKIGCRVANILYSYSALYGTITGESLVVKFESAYYGGSKNEKYCIPIALYGVKY